MHLLNKCPDNLSWHTIISFTFTLCIYMERKYSLSAVLKGHAQCAPTQWQTKSVENASLFIIIKISDSLIKGTSKNRDLNWCTWTKLSNSLFKRLSHWLSQWFALNMEQFRQRTTDSEVLGKVNKAQGRLFTEPQSYFRPLPRIP